MVLSLPGKYFLYRNALQGLGYGLMPMMGGVFELIARAAIVAAVARKLRVCGSVPGGPGGLAGGPGSHCALLLL